MRIQELVGIKNQPAFRAAQQFRKPPESRWMEIDPESLQSLNSEMQKLGWKFLKSGTFGAIYSNPKKKYVIKVMHGSGGGRYLEWLKYVLENQQNPHLPRIFGKARRLKGDVWAVRLEKLDPIKDQGFWDKYLMPTLRKKLKAERLERAQFLLDDDNVKFLRERYPELYTAILAAYRFGDDLFYGSGDGNIMRRGRVPVIIDP